MNPPLSIATMPLWLSAFLVIVVPTLVALLGPILIRSRVPVERLQPNNEVAGFKYAALAVIYGVLLAFVVIVVWEGFRDAQEFSHRESASLLNMYRLAEGFPDPVRQSLRERILTYTESVVRDEWTALAAGRPSGETIAAYGRMFDSVLAVEPATERQKAVYETILALLVRIGEQRWERVNAAGASLPGILWLTLVIGGVITVGFTYFFGSPNLWAQAAQVALVAGMICLTLLLIAKMDYPFAGDLGVQPDAFESVARIMRAIR